MDWTRTLPLLLLAACQAAPPATPPPENAKAIELAERVLERLGGREAWDGARHLSWTFFGGRRHEWDKHTGDLRIEDPTNDWTIQMNLHTREGSVVLAGEPVTDAVDRAEWLERGWGAWVNDSYWMFMPYKLLDPGVLLRHVGRGELEDGRGAELLELTFEHVGLTPQNRYVVFVADDTGLVERWDFYSRVSDPEPRMSTPWADWAPYAGEFGEIWLSGSRGQGLDWEIGVR